MRDFFAELRRRNVIRVAIAYIAVSWLLLQAGMLMFDLLALPRTGVRFMFALLLLGFVPTVILAWIYELTPAGLRRESEVDRGLEPRSANLTGRKLDFIIIAVLALVIAMLFADKLALSSRGTTAPTAPVATTAETRTIAAPAPNAPRPGVPPEPAPVSLAVLPFANLSADREQEYFSDGLSEELLFLLARIPQLRVTGRTSSFSFKGKNVKLTEIGRELNVAIILEGSVRRSGDRLRITTQLINVADGFPLWGETYNRELTDVFAVQDEIAGAVVAALKIKLLPEQRPAIGPHRTANPDAYDQYLLGRELLRPSNPDGWRHAAEAYEKAIALDPGFAAAYADLAVAKFYVSQFASTPEEIAREQAQAEAAANKALALDPELAAGYASRAEMRYLKNLDWAGAETDLRRALALDPADKRLNRRYATFLYRVGRLDEAIATIETAIALDPLSSEAWNSLGFYSNAAGRVDEARRALNRSYALNPENPYASFNLGCNSLQQGNATQALVEFERVPAGHFLRAAGIAMAEHELGHVEASRKALDELLAMPTAPPFWIAGVYAMRGELDQAFAWMERSYAKRDIYLPYVKSNPLMQNLRSDPRYDALLAKIGLGSPGM